MKRSLLRQLRRSESPSRGGSERAADERLNGLGRQEDAKPLTIALTRTDEAQRKAGPLNQDANALAAECGEGDRGRARNYCEALRREGAV